jgi:spermidine/putrescine transport system ATP-binding protein
MQKVLKDIQRNVGITFIYVTHDQTEALTMSDRIAVMKGGRVHQIGPPDEIYSRPATAFVASFIGEMNFLHGHCPSPGNGRLEAEVGGHLLRASRSTVSATAAAGDVLVCIRTERVRVNPQRGTEHDVEGTVRRIVYRGTDYEVTCAMADQEVRAVVSAVDWNTGLREGSSVRLGFNSGDITLFPREEETEIVQYTTEAV